MSRFVMSIFFGNLLSHFQVTGTWPIVEANEVGGKSLFPYALSLLSHTPHLDLPEAGPGSIL